MALAYESLLAAVRQHGKLTPAADEPTEAYLRRLVSRVADLPLQDFEALAPEAQQWFDAAADALQAGRAVPPPDGFGEEAEPPAPPAAPGRIARPSASGTAARHVLPPVMVPATTIDPGEPLATQVSRLMIADQTLSIDTVMGQLRGAGVHPKRGSVITLRNQALIFLRIIREEGWSPPHRT